MGFFSKIIDSLKYDDDDDFDEKEFEEYDAKEKEKEERREARQIHKASEMNSQNLEKAAPSAPSAARQNVHTVSNYSTTTYVENKNNLRSLRIERPATSKVIPISATHKGNQVCLMKPVVFDDSQDICDVIISECIAIVNLEGLDVALAQRIMDFISGMVYSTNGKLYPVSNMVYVITPESVDISGDYNEIIEKSGFDVPVFK